MTVMMLTPACAEMRASSMPPHKAEARDDGDGTYTLKWSADVAGEYELHISMEHAPISGSPFRCYVASGFARPPNEGDALKAALSTLQGEGRAPDGCPGTHAIVSIARHPSLNPNLNPKALTLPLTPTLTPTQVPRPRWSRASCFAWVQCCRSPTPSPSPKPKPEPKPEPKPKPKPKRKPNPEPNPSPNPTPKPNQVRCCRSLPPPSAGPRRTCARSVS